MVGITQFLFDCWEKLALFILLYVNTIGTVRYQYKVKVIWIKRWPIADRLLTAGWPTAARPVAFDIVLDLVIPRA
jgi:hypothetical protein